MMSTRLEHCTPIMVETWTGNADRICLDGQSLLEAVHRQPNQCKERRLRLTRNFPTGIERAR
jgi:hypothetical protein